MILIVVAVVGVDGFVIYIYTHTNVIYVYRPFKANHEKKHSEILLMQPLQK